MMIDDILDRTVTPVARLSGSVARTTGELVGDSAVQATGQLAETHRSVSSRSPSIAAAMLVLAALGGIVAMRTIFKGAVS